ncbi:MAG: hypothetical protein KDE06_01345, partial [Rhodobacteraceae bacterium]|nr:hypothetical protein [Paracoccaceae bacterium]
LDAGTRAQRLLWGVSLGSLGAFRRFSLACFGALAGAGGPRKVSLDLDKPLRSRARKLFKQDRLSALAPVQMPFFRGSREGRTRRQPRRQR